MPTTPTSDGSALPKMYTSSCACGKCRNHTEKRSVCTVAIGAETAGSAPSGLLLRTHPTPFQFRDFHAPLHAAAADVLQVVVSDEYDR